MKMLQIARVTVPWALVVCVALLRLESTHAANAVPVFSVILLLSAWRPLRELIIAILLLVGVDVFLTVFQNGGRPDLTSAVTWAWYVGAAAIGASIFRGVFSARRICACSLGAAITFFAASNFAVWTEWSLYPKTPQGLMACYEAALPFLRNSATAELVCSMIFGALTYLVSEPERRRLVQTTQS